MTEFILDNSVLSAFYKTGKLELLKEILEGHTVTVPEQVIREIAFSEIIEQIAENREQLSKKRWILKRM